MIGTLTQDEIDAGVSGALRVTLRNENYRDWKMRHYEIEMIQRRERILGLPEWQRFDTTVCDDMVHRYFLSTVGLTESEILNDILIAPPPPGFDTTAGWVREVEAENFLAGNLHRWERSSRLHRRTRGRPADSASGATATEPYQVCSYSAQLDISDQDLADFEHVGQLEDKVAGFRNEAWDLKKDATFSTPLKNPTLSADGTTVFNSGHANYASGVSSVLGGASVNSGLSAIGGQTLSDASDGSPIHLSNRAAYLLVPPALYGEALDLSHNLWTDEDPGPTVRMESRLGPAGVIDPTTDNIIVGSNTNWLLATRASDYASLVLVYLKGDNKSPRFVRGSFPPGSGEWGLRWSVSFNLCCLFVDWRGLYFSAGA